MLRHVTGTFPRLCGEDLVSAVALVCQDRGYYGQPSKRSAPTVFMPETRAKSFLRSASSGTGLGRSKRRVRTGLIVTECCHNRCSINVVESYCNPWPDDVVHDESAHIRLGKSAEEDIAEDDTQERPLNGPSQVDKAQEVAATPDALPTWGLDRVEQVEEVVANNHIPTSSMKSSPSPNRKKPRKDKSERRNSSRAAKQARREERRRNRERSSGGRSRNGRRKNKDTDRTARAKRQDLFMWRDAFADEGFPSLWRPDLTADKRRIAPLAVTAVGAAYSDTHTSLNQNTQRSAEMNDLENLTATNDEKEEEEQFKSRFSTLMTILRTLVEKITVGR